MIAETKSNRTLRFGLVVAGLVAALALILLTPVFSAPSGMEELAVDFPAPPSRVLVSQGQKVTKGQELAELDVSHYKEELQDAESELKALQADAQASIDPVSLTPSIAGVLPATVPEVKTVEVPARIEKPDETAVPKKALVVKSPDRSAAKATVEKAQKELDEATAFAAEADSNLVALQPKLSELEKIAADTAQKAANSKHLFDEGVISANRAKQLEDLSTAANDNLAKYRELITDAVAKRDDALARKQAAQAQLEKATLALSAPLPPVHTDTKPAAEPKKEVQHSTKIVMRKMPLVVKQDEAPAAPVQVSIDEDAFQQSQTRIAELQKRIEELKRKIEGARLVTPISGTVMRITDSAIWIAPTSTP